MAQEILSNLSEDMIGILNDLCGISKALESSSIGVLPSDGDFSYNTLTVCQDELLILCVGRKSPTWLLEHPDIEECVCLCATQYRGRILCGFPPLVGAMGGDSYIGNDIYNSLTRIMASEFRHECLELMLWVAFVGTLTAVVESMDRWIEAIRTLVGELQLCSWIDVQVILKKFLWYERRSEELWGDVWEKVERLRDSSEPTYSPASYF
jgi:hypothetical protein